jgi:hypothetical protein
VPSYYIVLEKKLAQLDLHVNCNALSNESNFLEKLAQKIGVTPLLSFISVRPSGLSAFVEGHGESIETLDIKAPAERWFSAEDGLKTVRELIHYLETSQPTPNEALSRDLKDFEGVLEAANQCGVRWHLAIDYRSVPLRLPLRGLN